LVRLRATPLMMPPTVSVSFATVTTRLAPSVTAPAPRLRLLVPTKVKLPFHVSGLLFKVTVEPLVLSTATPSALMVNTSVTPPSEAALFRFKVPALREAPPVKVLVPDSVTVPVVDFTREPVPPRMAAIVPFCTAKVPGLETVNTPVVPEMVPLARVTLENCWLRVVVLKLPVPVTVKLPVVAKRLLPPLIKSVPALTVVPPV